jgi:hypothetical protein
MFLAVVVAVAILPATVASAASDPPQVAVAAAAPTAGTFTGLAPARVLDTRTGLGSPGPVGAHGTVVLHVVGVSGVPATNVAAVALTVTATRTTASGYLTVFPDGAARPDASNLNFTAGQTVANMVIVPVGVDGKIRLFNGAGSKVDIVADVAGYYTGGTPSVAGSFRALTVKRLLDTRSGAARAAVRPGASVTVPVTGRGGVPATGVASVVVNLTATAGVHSGYLTVYAHGAVRPVASSLNFASGRSVADLAVVPVGADGRISVYNGSGGSVHVLVDVLGYYRAGAATALGSYQSVSQQRMVDTRTGLGGAGLLDGHTTMPLRVLGTAGIPSSRVSAVVVNLTVVSPRSAGYLSAYPSNASRPNTSSVNFGTHQTVTALATVQVGSDGYLRLYNGGAATDVVVDIVGYFVGSNARPCNMVPTDPSGTSVTRWNPVVRCVLGMLGVAQSGPNVADVDTVIGYESSGDPDAVNNWDSNAQAGHPSKGLVQVIQPTFDYYRSRTLPTNLYDPAANVYAGMHYAISTYGSIHNIPGLVSLRNGGRYKGYIVTR